FVLDLDRHANDQLNGSSLDLVRSRQLRTAADPCADPNGNGIADPVAAVVDTYPRRRLHDLVKEPAPGQGQGEMAMGDARPERSALGALGIDVDPLFVAGDL